MGRPWAPRQRVIQLWRVVGGKPDMRATGLVQQGPQMLRDSRGRGGGEREGGGGGGGRRPLVNGALFNVPWP